MSGTMLAQATSLSSSSASATAPGAFHRIGTGSRPTPPVQHCPMSLPCPAQRHARPMRRLPPATRRPTGAPPRAKRDAGHHGGDAEQDLRAERAVDRDRRARRSQRLMRRASTTSAATATQAHQRWRKWSQERIMGECPAARRETSPPSGTKPPLHQRPGVGCKARVQAGHPGAEQQLQEQHSRNGERQAGDTGWARSLPSQPRRRRSQRGPDQPAQRRTARSAGGSTAGSGVTSVMSLPRPERTMNQPNAPCSPPSASSAEQPRLVASGNRAAHPEPRQRQRKGKADHPSQQAVEPFPEIDELERRPASMPAGPLTLWYSRGLLIDVEFGLPLRLGQRRQSARHGLPFGDRQPAFGQPGDPAHGDHDRAPASATANSQRAGQAGAPDRAARCSMRRLPARPCGGDLQLLRTANRKHPFALRRRARRANRCALPLAQCYNVTYMAPAWASITRMDSRPARPRRRLMLSALCLVHCVARPRAGRRSRHWRHFPARSGDPPLRACCWPRSWRRRHRPWRDAPSPGHALRGGDDRPYLHGRCAGRRRTASKRRC